MNPFFGKDQRRYQSDEQSESLHWSDSYFQNGIESDDEYEENFEMTMREDANAQDEFQQWLAQEERVIEKYKQPQQEGVYAAQQDNVARQQEMQRQRMQEIAARKAFEQQRAQEARIESQRIAMRRQLELEKRKQFQEQQRLAEEQQRMQQQRFLADQQERERIRLQKIRQQEMEIERLRVEKEKAEEVARLKIEEERRLALQRIEQERRQQREIELQRLQQIKLQELEIERLRIEKEQAEREALLIRQHEEQLEQERIQMEQMREAQALQMQQEQEEMRREAERIRTLQLEVEKQLEREEQLERKHEMLLAKKKKQHRDPMPTGNKFSFREFFLPVRFAFGFNMRSVAVPFGIALVVITLGIGGISFAQRGFNVKGKVLGVSEDGYGNLNAAAANLARQNFDGSSKDFAEAYQNFSTASAELENYGGIMVEVSRFIPKLSKLSSGKNVTEAGMHIAAAGSSLNNVVQRISAVKDGTSNGGAKISFLKVFETSKNDIEVAKNELAQAQENIEKVNIDDLPEDKRQAFLELKTNLPKIVETFNDFLNNSSIFVDLLGGNGPRKYLFIFQNNNEMRATGGFIGSYGLLDISQGHVRQFFIDGIFNPDGQLKDKIVPPLPIQKISAAWSLHDSNWFPDFPMSAQKAIMFYEKTGGPTADGVIALTPTVMQKLLVITGPIEMPEYDVTLTADNFVEKTQFEVEIDYDKEENKPKKILSDLAPLVFEKLLSSPDVEVTTKAVAALSDGLREKHILLYSQDEQLQKIISQQGWSGEMLKTEKDYISVINSNINGYKTDGVIDEAIEHKAEIQDDGSIIDTVRITRKHTGGNTAYEWWNKVNADYMRVYVPKGSQLIDVQGQTREVNQSPLEYDALGFKRDDVVEAQEKSMVIDEKTGTRIYEEAGKTVFANWTYVSPQETMTITYTYKLPFTLFQVSEKESIHADSYSLVAQKQSGSKGSAFTSEVTFPHGYELKWKTPNSASAINRQISITEELDMDQFIGLVFEKKTTD